MSKQTGRFRWVARLARFMLVVTLVFLGLLLIAGVAWVVDTIYLAVSKAHSPGVVAGFYHVVSLAASIVLPLVAGGWLVVLLGLVHVLVANEQSVRSAAGRLGRVESLLADQAASTRELSDLAALSDQAKSLLFRHREIEALRETIHEDLIRQDYQTAEALVESMADRSGYADEAARLRQEIEAARKATVEEKIDAAVERIHKIVSSRDWARAVRESQRIGRIFPDNAKVAALPEQIEAARTRHKRSLLREYGEAVRRNDVERGIELLKELDLYLTPQEAAALEESARGVFRAKLHNLGVQFAISVTDQQWAAAVATGEEIVHEFPNSRMAEEVQEKMDLLRARAQAAEEGGSAG